MEEPAPRRRPRVFLAHAGQEKHELVDTMHTLLTRLHDIDTFLDAHSIRPGTEEPPQLINTRLLAADVVVMVLSRAFLRKKYPMEELRLVMERRRQDSEAGTRSQRICVVLHGVTFEDCSAAQFPPAPDGGTVSDIGPEHAESCKQALTDLLQGHSCLRADVVRGFEGKQAEEAAQMVIDLLITAERLPKNYGNAAHNLVPRHGDLLGHGRQLRRILSAMETGRQITIVGGPGEGKTALAAEAAHIMSVRGWLPGGAYAVDLSTAPAAGGKQALESLLTTQLVAACSSNLGCWDLADNSSWADLVPWLRRSKHSLLLVLENAESMLQDDQRKEDLLDVLEELHSCPPVHLVVASRIQCNSESTVLELDPLPEDDAQQLLIAHSGQAAEDWQPGDARKLAAACRNNALLLKIIGAALAGGRRNMQDALLSAQSDAGPLSLLEDAERGSVRGNRRIKKANAWLQSLLSAEEISLLTRLALFRNNVSEGAAQAVQQGMTTAQQHLQNLRDCCLLAVAASRPTGERFSMHPVVWDFAECARRQQPKADQLEGLEAFMGWLLQRGTRLAELQRGTCDPAGIAEAHQLLADELPSFEALSTYLGQPPLSGTASILQAAVVQDLNNLTKAVAKYGRCKTAADLQRHTVDIAVRVFGNRHETTFWSQNTLAAQLGELGLYDEAASINKEVLRNSRRVLGPEHLVSLTSHGDWAVLLGKLGQHNEAAAMQREVLAIMQRVLGPEHPDTLSSRQNLAHEMGELGQHKKAVSMFRKVLAMRQRVLAHEDSDTLTSHSSLAFELGKLGRHAKAADMHGEVLAIMQRMLSPEHPDTLTCHQHWAFELGELRQHAEAAARYREVMAIQRRVLGLEDSDTLITRNNLAIELGELGQHDDAAAIHRDVLAIRQRELGLERSDTFTSRRELAIQLGKLGQHTAAVAMHREVLTIRRRVLGREHSKTLTSHREVATQLSMLGRHGEAAVMLRKLLKIQKRVLGPKHPDALVTLNQVDLAENRLQRKFSRTFAARTQGARSTRQRLE